MFKKYIITFLLVILSQMLLSDEKSLWIKGDAEPIPNIIIPDTYRNNSGMKAALIIFKPDYDFDLHFQPSEGDIQGSPTKDGIEWNVYVSPGEKKITVSALGYKNLEVYLFNHKITYLQSGEAYRLHIFGDMPESAKQNVVFNVNPVDSEISLQKIDNDVIENYFTLTETATSLITGKYNLKIQKIGYQTIEDVININKDNFSFQYILPILTAKRYVINTIPEGASVEINNEIKGNTPLPIHLFPYEYDIRISKPLYKTIYEKLSINNDTESIIQYELLNNSGTLEIVVEQTDAIFDVIINQISRGYQRSFELNPGIYSIELKSNQYKTPTAKNIQITKDEISRLPLSLTPLNAYLDITQVTPGNALIEVFDYNNQLILSSRENRIVETLLIGDYIIKATAPDYFDKNFEVSLKEEEIFDQEIRLQANDKLDDFVYVPRQIIYGKKQHKTFIGKIFNVLFGWMKSDTKDIIITEAFYISKYEVTQHEWDFCMSGINQRPFSFKERSGNIQPKHPAENVSWYATLVYCNLRSINEGLQPVYSINGKVNPSEWGNIPVPGNNSWRSVSCDWNANGYRLPTEAEWLYAAQGADKSMSYRYAGSNNKEIVAWFDRNSNKTTQPVGTKQANEIGIYDMNGNVWEWCWDWHSDSFDPKQELSRGNPTGTKKVLKGGSWNNSDRVNLRHRFSYDPTSKHWDIGFRVVRTIKD